MALDAYLRVRSQKQGDLKGSVTIKGREGSIAVHSFTHEVDSPRDLQSGLATGKRMHKPFLFVKEIDQSSPRFWQALVTNESLVSCQFQMWDTAESGAERQVYTITLTNANVASIREFMLDNEQALTAKTPVREEVSLTYQRIEWTWTAGGVTAADDWEARV